MLGRAECKKLKMSKWTIKRSANGALESVQQRNSAMERMHRTGRRHIKVRNETTGKQSMQVSFSESAQMSELVVRGFSCGVKTEWMR